ncbi:hypothetical protein [Streptomyces cathayae]|uniref:AMP-binding enzyme C-terminal domain-containing protein n=1 Tax=Streptomyces cathayae TaxID=3031124 RepID=A0ABY8JSS0_9ACTN|nr:hypothetical protein [Streptomyces sp. HUAS 5]WGD39030.1 hypothetical protein PYS65_01945 [Streptomyces sp. HUAS 5]
MRDGGAVFTAGERAHCRSRADPDASLSGLLSATDAFVKALSSMGGAPRCTFLEIEIEIDRGPVGQPRLRPPARALPCPASACASWTVGPRLRRRGDGPCTAARQHPVRRLRRATDHRTTRFDTGNLGRLDAGLLPLGGRRFDRVSANGTNVFAADVEQAAGAEAGVAECVVLPYGASFAVVVVAERGLSVGTARLAARIAADFAVAPETVVEVPHSAVVRTASGKPARTHMTARLAEGGLLPQPATAAVVPRPNARQGRPRGAVSSSARAGPGGVPSPNGRPPSSSR